MEKKKDLPEETPEISGVDGSDDISDVSEITTDSNGSRQSTTKRKLPISEIESPPVPVKKSTKNDAVVLCQQQKMKGEENRKQKDHCCPDVTFLQEVNKFSVPGKLILSEHGTRLVKT